MKKTTRVTVAPNLPVAVLLGRDVYEEGSAEGEVAKDLENSCFPSDGYEKEVARNYGSS